jgi:hypothetical protein
MSDHLSKVFLGIICWLVGYIIGAFAGINHQKAKDKNCSK